MDPSFKTIADLFQAPAAPTDLAIEESERPKHGKDAEESEALGKAFLSDGDYQEAIRHFKEAIAHREPGDARTRVDLAGAYDYADQAPQALRQYLIAIAAKQDEGEARVGVGDLYRRQGRFRDSILALEKAIETDPANPFFHIKLAEALREAGEPSRALAAAQGAVAAKPDEAFYHYWVGDLLISMKRYEEALEALRAAIELSPGDDHYYVRAAVAFWNADRKTEAVKAIRLASDLDPDKHVYHGLLGILLDEMHLHEEAEQESARSQKMDRYDHDTISRLLDEMGIEP